MIKYILLLYFFGLSLHIEHCLKHINICKKCDSNSFLVRTSSLSYCSKIDHCIQISDDEQTCNECMDAYEKTSTGQCNQKYELIENCLEYKQNSCDKCYLGYAVTFDKKKCIEFPNCEKLTADTSKCQKCRDSYKLNSDGKCEVTTCDSFRNNTCEDCTDGFYLDNDKTCKQIPIKYCESGNSSSCFHCKEGTEFDINKNCVLKDYIIECDDYSKDGKTCIKCRQGYSFNADKTKCELKYCQETEQICFLCEDGYFPEGNICKSYNGDSFFKFNYIVLFFLAFLSC